MSKKKKTLTAEELQVKKIKKNKFAKRRWQVFRQVNRLYWFVAIVALVGIGVMGSSVYGKYKDTLNWKKNSSKVTMASQSLDLLYDKDPKSKESKISFDNLRAKLINSDGTLTKAADRTNLKKLERYLKEINTKGSEKDYKKLYAEIALKYSLKLQYDNLFANKAHTSLKKDISPSTIAQLNDSAFDDLQTLFLRNNDDKFVSNYLAGIETLLDDVDSFNELVDTFNSAVVIKNKEVTLKDGYHDNLEATFGATHSKLNYNWDSTKYMTNIVTMLKPVVAKTQEAYLTYGKYETDMANKQAAYEAWQATQADFLEQVKAIHAAAVKEKHEREEKEKKEKELADAKGPSKQQIDNLENLTEQDKINFKKRIDEADSMDKLQPILSEAQALDLKIKQDKEKEEADKTKPSTPESTPKVSAPDNKQ